MNERRRPDRCGACDSKEVEWVAASMIPPKKSYYGWECLNCHAFMDVVGGKTHWEIQTQGTEQ